MRSFGLFALLLMLIGAVHVQQNPEMVSVNLVGIINVIPLGIWDAMVFVTGGVFMWIAMTCGSIESRARSLAVIEKQQEEIFRLREDRREVLRAIASAEREAEEKSAQ